jgi:Tol biopolymer transport system component
LQESAEQRQRDTHAWLDDASIDPPFGVHRDLSRRRLPTLYNHADFLSMSLALGTRLGPYEITAQIGAGGMGEVYRATDTNLNRQVAIKVLPEAMAFEPERLARFDREAKTLAALNHPNIAQIHGLERSDGTTALVMELVEGPTLADRIAQRPIPVDEALPIARQIAEALEAAHEQGIVHRDLKPANIKVREDGTVKILDFGLAKAMDPAGAASASPSQSPTLTTPAMTQAGVILGTAAYMAPEQARGRTVDRRADIWAFGVLLDEMLTGTRMFERETVSDTLAAVLTKKPDVDALPPEVPAYITHLLRRCLDPDPKMRLRDIGEARVLLARGGEPQAPPVVAPSQPRRLGGILAAGAALVATAAGLGWWVGHQPAPAPAVWSQDTRLTDQVGEENWPAMSPDGQSFAYSSRARGSWDIYVQRIGGRNSTLVAGEPALDETAPAFSPDGATIAFHESSAKGGIFIVGATGESVRRLTDFGFNPAWSPDGRQIAFCTEEVVDPHVRSGTSELWVADAAGGTPRKIYDGDAVEPAWSPSGTRIAFWAADGGQRDIKTIPAGGGPAVPVLRDPPLDWSPAWAPDGKTLYLASDRGGSMNLWQIAIDEVSGKALGPPEPVTGGVQADIAEVSVSHDGSRLIFRANLSSVVPVTIPFDQVAEHLGTPVPLIRRNGALEIGSVARDGQWLALYAQGERQEDIFVSRADGSGLRRVTDDAFRDRGPVWSPDGTELAFYSNRSGIYQIWIIKPDGSGLRQVTSSLVSLQFPLYSPAGDRLVVSDLAGHTMFMDPNKAAADQRPVSLNTTLPGGFLAPLAWSPDRRRLAGMVRVPNGAPVGVGVYDIAAGRATRIGDDLGVSGMTWLADSRRLLFVDAKGRLWLMDVDSKRRRELTVPPPYRLFNGELAFSPDGRTLYGSGTLAESDVWMVERGK